MQKAQVSRNIGSVRQSVRLRKIESHRHGEEGAALLIALVLFGLIMVISIGASSWGVSAMHGQEQRESLQDEYWRARSAASNVEAYLQYSLPQQYEKDILSARQMAGARPLPSFDKSDVSALQSRPVARISNGQVERTQYALNNCTSLLGQLNAWASARTPLAESYAATRGYGSDVVKVADFSEISRRQFQNGEPSYLLRYKVDAVAGHNRVRPIGEVLLGPALIGCETTVEMIANPDTIIRGNSTTFTVTYAHANRLLITKVSTGEILLDQAVSEQSNAQTVTLPYAPQATDTYTVQAFASGGCTAVSPPVPVTVNDPPCPQIRTFVANPTSTTPGGNVTLTWDVINAVDVRINGTQVAASGSMVVNPLVTTTYTLQAVGPNGWCPQSAQVTVTVIPCPVIQYFEVVPANITNGQSATLRWSVLNVGAGVSVTIDGNPVAASGTMTVSPSTTTTYHLRVVGPGTCSPQDAYATLQVTQPPCPTITSFTVTPANVNIGDIVTVSWSVANAGNASSITLSGPGINQQVAASGSLTFTMNSDGTFTFTLQVVPSVAGCTTQTASSNVTVKTAPGPTCPTINNFTAAPSCIVPFGSSTLTWDVSDADAISINGTSGYPLSGSLTVNPSSTTTYTLAAVRSSCTTVTRQVTVQVGSPAIINSFVASPNSIFPGQPSTLSWSISGGVSATINGTPVDPSSGSITVSPASTTDYTLLVQSAGCAGQPISQTVRVTVASCPQPSINYFQASPAQVIAGGSTQLQWSVSNVQAGGTVSLSGPGVNRTVQPVDSTVVTPPAAPGSYTYRISAVNPCNPGLVVEQTVTVQVVACPAPIIASFTANPSNVTQGSGGFIRLSWSISDPSGQGLSVSISPTVGGGLPSSGFVDISAPATTTTYTLTAVAGCGSSSSAQTTVTVGPPACAPFTSSLPPEQIPASVEILYFHASRNVVYPVEPGNFMASIYPTQDTSRVEFDWDTKGADSVTINGVAVPLRGNRSYFGTNLSVIPATYPQFPTNSTTYVIEAWNSSNPSVRQRYETYVKWRLDPPLKLYVVQDFNNHSAGESVPITYYAGVQRWNGLDNSGVTVDIEGVASGLPSNGTYNLSAGATREFKFIARRGGETAEFYCTLIVEDPSNAGPGWEGTGTIPSGWSTWPLGAAAKMRRLSNGAIQLRAYPRGFGVSTTGGGFGIAGEWGMPLVEFYKDGDSLLSKYDFADYAPGPMTEYNTTFKAEFNAILPASQIPNPACGRVDIKVLAVYQQSNAIQDLTALPYLELFDTRTGFVKPGSSFQLHNPWTQALWDVPLW